MHRVGKVLTSGSFIQSAGVLRSMSTQSEYWRHSANAAPVRDLVRLDRIGGKGGGEGR